MWCDTLSETEWVSYVPARDGCTLLLGATVPPRYKMCFVLWCSCVFFIYHSLLNDTKCSFIIPLLEISNSVDLTTVKDKRDFFFFFQMVVCPFYDLRSTFFKLNQCGSSQFKRIGWEVFCLHPEIPVYVLQWPKLVIFCWAISTSCVARLLG